jgi:hypothetical protein
MAKDTKEILLPNETIFSRNYIMTKNLDDFRKAFRHYHPEVHKAVSGSFWIQRVMGR